MLDLHLNWIKFLKVAIRLNDCILCAEILTWERNFVVKASEKNRNGNLYLECRARLDLNNKNHFKWIQPQFFLLCDCDFLHLQPTTL